MHNNAIVAALMVRHEYDEEQVLEWCHALIEEHEGHFKEIIEQLDLDVTPENIDALNRIGINLYGIYTWFRGEKRMHYKNEVLLNMGKLVLSDLRAMLFDCHITGGFARDIASHNIAKDLDICVYNFHPNDPAEEKFYSMLVTQLEGSYNSVEVFDQYPVGEDEDTKDALMAKVGRIPEYRQVHSVIKIMHEGQSVDIIFIEDRHPNPEGMFARFNKGRRMDNIQKVVRCFDCNVNMFIWNEDENMPEYIGPHLSQFIINHSNLGPERLAKNHQNWIGFSNDLEGESFEEYTYIGRARNA